MPKRTGKTPDVAQNAARLNHAPKGASAKTAPPEKNPAAVALGKLGGAKGGRARARNMTKEALSEIGRKGAAARWSKKARGGGPK